MSEAPPDQSPPEAPAAAARRPPQRLIRDPTAPCRNCGDARHGNFCANCGQRKGDGRASLRRLISELVDDEFSINSTLPRTVVGLLFRPGFLTAEYLDGRIVRYVQPFRVYLLSSVIFFLLLSFVGTMAMDRGRLTADAVGRGFQAAIDSVRADTALAATPARRDSIVAEMEAARDRAASAVSARAQIDGEIKVNTGWAAFDDRVRRRIEELAAMPMNQAIRTVARDFLNRAPLVVFLVLPIFALLMKILYIRQRRYYVEHFIFALHLHAFWFAAFTVMLIFRYPLVLTLTSVWIMIYVFLAMRRVYGQGFIKTGLKYGILAWVYPAVVAVGVLITLLVTLVLD